jgi:CRP-like cAMP-binding protein
MNASVVSVEGRIANILLLLSKKLGETSRVGLLIDSCLRRDDLAAMSVTTTETASRLISQFQKEGLIQTGGKWVSILDPVSLEQITGSAED